LNNPGSDIQKYCNYIDEAKQRLATIQQFTKGSASISTLGRTDYDIEFVAIQLRKTLELIAFSSLIANRKVYSDAYTNYSKQWNPKYMLKDLEKVNPNFYPRPVYCTEPDERGVKHIEYIKDGFLTKDEFVFLYDKCGKALHALNPYSNANVVNLQRSVDEWVQRIGALLLVHRVTLVGTDETWIVYLQYPLDNKVHAFASTPASEDELEQER
jgi:hypothetical protein